jgi:hypothetical protein
MGSLWYSKLIVEESKPSSSEFGMRYPEQRMVRSKYKEKSLKGIVGATRTFGGLQILII